MAKIVLVTKGSGGDLFPFLHLGKELQKRGHEIVLISHWYYEEASARAGLRFAALDTPETLPLYEEQTTLNRQTKLGQLADKAVLAGSHTAQEQAGQTDAPRLSVFGLSPAQGLVEYEVIHEHCRASDTVLVVNYVAFLSAKPVADKLGLPFATIFMAPGFIPKWILDLPFFDELYGHIGRDLNLVREKVGLAPVHDWRSWLVSADRLIGMWPEWFAPAEMTASFDITAVGFAWDELVTEGEFPREVAQLLEAGRAPVLITHGTSIPARPNFFGVAVEACRLLDVPALLVCKYEKLIPPDLPGNVKWFKYLPFGKLMRHTSAIIHHAGIGTCGQALVAGIPQLVLELGNDRAGNARCLQTLGIAASLAPAQWRPQPVAEALGGLLASESVKRRCRELAQRLSEADSANAACEAVEALTVERGFQRMSRAAAPPDAQQEPPARGAEPPAQSKPAAMLDALGKMSPAERAHLAQRLKERLKARSPQQAH